MTQPTESSELLAQGQVGRKLVVVQAGHVRSTTSLPMHYKFTDLDRARPAEARLSALRSRNMFDVDTLVVLDSFEPCMKVAERLVGLVTEHYPSVDGDAPYLVPYVLDRAADAYLRQSPQSTGTGLACFFAAVLRTTIAGLANVMVSTGASSDERFWDPTKGQDLAAWSDQQVQFVHAGAVSAVSRYALCAVVGLQVLQLSDWRVMARGGIDLQSLAET